MKKKFAIDEKQLSKYSDKFSDKAFWQKLLLNAKRLGIKGVKHCIEMYYVLKRPDVPIGTKGAIIAGLGYLICPYDLVTDFLPGIGLADDVAVISMVYSHCAKYVDGNMKMQANNMLKKFI